MREDFKNKISRLELENFTCFSKAEFDFSSGINIFIGENGTGKTHILKCLYALLNTSNFIATGKNIDTEGNAKYNFQPYFIFDTFLKTFKGPDFYNTVSKNKLSPFQNYCRVLELKTSVSVKLSNQAEYGFIIFTDSDSKKEIVQPTISLGEGNDMKKNIYLPTTDVLNIYRDILTLEKERENGFDLTYINLASALIDKPLRKKPKLVEELEEALKINVLRNGDEFFIKFDNDKAEIHSSLVATGINKLAQLIYLIMNGSLTKDSILFWDEPEVNLNPKYVTLVVEFLQTLATAGVQIFVATHDYLLSHKLSLAAEYRVQTAAPPMKFFNLYKGDNGSIVESGKTLVEINHNAILDESAAFYDLESNLFAQSRK